MAIRLLKAGRSIKSVARSMSGVLNVSTVRTLRRSIPDHEVANCPCGKPDGHNGWCSWRISQSPRFQRWQKRVPRHGAKGLRNFNGRKTHCPSGHPYSEENTIWACHHTLRFCRECNRLRAVARRRAAKFPPLPRSYRADPISAAGTDSVQGSAEDRAPGCSRESEVLP